MKQLKKLVTRNLGGEAPLTAEKIFYGIEAIFYLALFALAVISLRGIRRELKRIADRLYWPTDEEAPTED